MTTTPPALNRRAHDREGRLAHEAVREVETRRRWRAAVIWSASLAAWAAFGWLSLLATLFGSAGIYERLRWDALTAFVAAAACLLFFGRRQIRGFNRRRLRILGGILYLSALGGLLLLGLWLALLGLTSVLINLLLPDASVLPRLAWLISTVLVFGLGFAGILALLRLSPGVARP